MDHSNPYEPPLASVIPEQTDVVPELGDASEEIDDGVWRDFGMLVVRKGSVLPLRCVKCNAPAARLKKLTLNWHPPGLYFLLIAPLIYVIVVVIVRQSIPVSAGICERHRAQQRRSLFIAWLLVFGGLLSMILAGCLLGAARHRFSLPLLLGGIAAIAVGALYGVLGPRLLWPERIDSYFAWINGACDAYLAELPEVPEPSVPSIPRRP